MDIQGPKSTFRFVKIFKNSELWGKNQMAWVNPGKSEFIPRVFVSPYNYVLAIFMWVRWQVTFFILLTLPSLQWWSHCRDSKSAEQWQSESTLRGWKTSTQVINLCLCSLKSRGLTVIGAVTRLMSPFVIVLLLNTADNFSFIMSISLIQLHFEDMRFVCDKCYFWRYFKCACCSWRAVDAVKVGRESWYQHT